jgi:hypothetical protein
VSEENSDRQLAAQAPSGKKAPTHRNVELFDQRSSTLSTGSKHKSVRNVTLTSPALFLTVDVNSLLSLVCGEDTALLRLSELSPSGEQWRLEGRWHATNRQQQ